MHYASTCKIAYLATRTFVDAVAAYGRIKQAVPKVISEQRVALTQNCNRVPIGYDGTPQIQPQNCPFPFDDHYSI